MNLFWRKLEESKFERLNLWPLNPFFKLPDLIYLSLSELMRPNYGVRAISLQYVDDIPCPVIYASSKFLDRERRYSPVERECLVKALAGTRFRYYSIRHKVYLGGRPRTNDLHQQCKV